MAHPVTENQPAGSVSLVSFTPDLSGVPVTMRIEHLNARGLGEFRHRQGR